ncbi:hypothetical protein GH714_008813 [Hevea brasiliensis]|uniref:Uncharacterized protein n=1 Tax=Hevea brasiliensis TaxID=3981 RepID=A0A6A6M0R4_HEVBR|nr:hypothetical protein GH714_008813 [Hevea brasiliensis]
MENSYETCKGNGLLDNGHTTTRHTPYQPSIKVPTPWLDLRVFFVRVSKCEIDDSTPEFLTVNHIPLHPDMLFEVNGIRISVNSDGPSIVLRRDRLDKKSEEATFVSTDSIRINGSVKFEVFDKDVLMLSGVLEMCNSNGLMGKSRGHGQRWSMNCESICQIYSDHKPENEEDNHLYSGTEYLEGEDGNSRGSMLVFE